MNRKGPFFVVPAVIVAVAVLLAGCAKQEPKKVRKPKPIPSKTVGLRQPIEVGAFKYELLKSEESTMIGPPGRITSSRARGRFIVVQFRAELVSDRTRALDRREVTLVDSKGKEYRSNLDAQGALQAARRPNLFKQDTTYRGIPVTGWLAFDIPKNTSGLRLKIIDLLNPKVFIGYITLPYGPMKK